MTVGGIIARCRFFDLENLSQHVILGRTWERVVKTKYDNREDGGCYATIFDEDGNDATFCSGTAKYE